MRKGCAGQLKIAILRQFFDDRTSFRAKGLRRTTENRNFTSFFTDRTSFRAKRLPPRMLNRNFTAVFDDRNLISCERVAFSGASLALPRLKREIEKKEREEGKRARGQEGKREKMRRCEDVKVFEDVYTRPPLLEEPSLRRSREL